MPKNKKAFIFLLLPLFLLSSLKGEFKGFYLGESIGNAFNIGNFSATSSSAALFGLPHDLSLSSSTKSCKESIWGEIYAGWAVWPLTNSI